jgi:hypothetical protein
VALTESPTHLQKFIDAKFGLALIQLYRGVGSTRRRNALALPWMPGMGQNGIQNSGGPNTQAAA